MLLFRKNFYRTKLKKTHTMESMRQTVSNLFPNGKSNFTHQPFRLKIHCGWEHMNDYITTMNINSNWKWYPIHTNTCTSCIRSFIIKIGASYELCTLLPKQMFNHLFINENHLSEFVDFFLVFVNFWNHLTLNTIDSNPNICYDV